MIVKCPASNGRKSVVIRDYNESLRNDLPSGRDVAGSTAKYRKTHQSTNKIIRIGDKSTITFSVSCPDCGLYSQCIKDATLPELKDSQKTTTTPEHQPTTFNHHKRQRNPYSKHTILSLGTKMAIKTQLTLFLWPTGLFPRRINYWLFIKGLVSSYDDILSGATSDPNLTIVRLSLNFPARGWKSTPADDPLPEHISTSSPCLRVRDASPSSTGTTTERWIRESSSILEFLEAHYAAADHHHHAGPTLLNANNIADVAATSDRVGQLNLAIIEGLTYIRHACPEFAAFAGLKDDERSAAAARIGLQSMMKGLAKVLDWARADSLATTGWLTPGTDGPGLVDVNLAAPRRYLEIVYGWNIFEGEELRPLEEWYGRFRKLDWWDGFEEREDVRISEFKFTVEKVVG